MSPSGSRHNLSLSLILIVTVISCCTGVPLTGDSLPEDVVLADEARLIRTLTQRYEQVGTVTRPVVNSSRPVHVALSLMLYQLINVDEAEQFITLKLWIHMIWSDEFLVWKPEEYGGIRSIIIPPSHIWTPDLEVYNIIDSDGPLLDRSRRYLAQVNYRGQVHWVPSSKFSSGCQIDMRRFPFDEQRCEIILASWAMDIRLLDLVFDGEESLDISAFIQSNEWILAKTSAWKSVERYMCNHSQVAGFADYAQLIHSITVRRHLGFYVYALIIPSILLSFLMPLTFWIPTTGDGRITLGMSLFSSFFVLLLVLIEASPTSASVSNLGIYFCCNMILLAMTSVVSVVIVNISNRDQHRPIPRWTRKHVVVRGVDYHNAYSETATADVGTDTMFHDSLSRVFLCCHELDSSRHRPTGGSTVGLKHSPGGDLSVNTTAGESSTNQRDWTELVIVLDRVCFTLSVTAVVATFVVFFPR